MDFIENVGRRSETGTGEVGSFVNLDSRSLNGYERNKLFRNEGFDDAGRLQFAPFGHLANVARTEDGRAAAVLDVDSDGDLDLLLQNFAAPTTLLVNQGENAGNWLQVKLHGTASNREAIGARVTIENGESSQLREVTSTAGYMAGQSLIVHFGLADAEQVERLVVRWPSGQISELEAVAAGQRIEIVEGREGYETWTPPAGEPTEGSPVSP